MLLSGFVFNRIVIIQSLEPNEVATGRMLSDYIKNRKQQRNDDLPVEIISCGYAQEFIQIIERLQQEAALGNIPLLHVECHGDEIEGLEFENGSNLKWDEVANALLPLNIASKFNLLAVFSACFGGHFLGQMGVLKPAPCWCIVAPTESVDPGEIYGGFRAFYSALLDSDDLGRAISAISKCKLNNGRWFCESAETWFETVIVGYVKTHCNNNAAKKRAKSLYRQLKNQGQHNSIGSILRKLRDRNREDLLGKYFDCYFSIKEVPENTHRFCNVKKRVRVTLDELRCTGRYTI